MKEFTGLQSNTEYSERIFVGEQLSKEGVISSSFYDCTFKNCTFVESVFENCRFVNCRFEKCDLSLVQLPGCTFNVTSFVDSKFAGVDWTLAEWSSAGFGDPIGFTRCLLNHSTFIGLKLCGIHFIECVAVDVDFREADLSQVDFSGTDLSESLFSNTNLTGADLSRACNYHIAPDLNILKAARFSMPEAMSLLYSMDIILEGGKDNQQENE